MNVKRYLSLALALILSLSLVSCGGASEEGTASVQSVAMLMGIDLTGSSQYAGIVEAAATIEVEKDPNKTVEECFVKAGDQVKAGDLLFTYDTDALELTVSTAELEVEQLKNSIASYEAQISALEKDKKKASSSEKLTYTLQIQEAQLNMAEAEYNLKQKEAELQRLKEGMSETEVYAQTDGLVQAVNDPDSNQNEYYGYESGSGNSNAYITIMEVGTYRIKATVSEEVIYSLTPGMEMTAVSRTDSSKSWHGVIDSINTSSPEQNNNNNNYYYSSDGESSSKYAFYVALDSSDGLLIGQHVYLKEGSGAAEEEASTVVLPSGYLVDVLSSGPSVWAANDKDQLELRKVTLGEYNEEMDTYEITEGLSLEDYIAYPEESLSEGMAVIKYDDSSFGGDVSVEGGEYAEGEGYEEYEEYEEGGVVAESEVAVDDVAAATAEMPVDDVAVAEEG